ncbi:unnamed protein product [Rhodiola kirilowii]
MFHDKLMKMKYMHVERKWVFPIVVSSFVCIFILAATFNMGLVASLHTLSSFLAMSSSHYPANRMNLISSESSAPQAGPKTPRFAYFISGSKGDLENLWRTLLSLYHPLNHYILHLDLESPVQERLKLARRVERHPLFVSVGNVYMIKKANMVTYRGPTMVANTLHACAVLLKQNKEWDWFINLSATDYPLVTQDDLLHAFTDLNRSLNFVEHTSRLGWKIGQRAKPMIVDPGLYLNTKRDIFFVPQKRALPTAFKLFTGSAWMVLSHSFVEYLIWGWDNLPRTLLMYYTNFVSSPEGYFQTVLCNAPEYIPTAVNHDMHYITWDIPPQQHPHVLNINDTTKMILSNAAFARKFKRNDPVLDLIDRKLLHRRNSSVTPGGWCAGNPSCSSVGDPYKIKPGPGARRLRRLIDRLVSRTQNGQQCL